MFLRFRTDGIPRVVSCQNPWNRKGPSVLWEEVSPREVLVAWITGLGLSLLREKIALGRVPNAGTIISPGL